MGSGGSRRPSRLRDGSQSSGGGSKIFGIAASNNDTMALPVFSSGMNQRKGKTPPSHASKNEAKIDHDGHEKFTGKALFHRTKHRMTKTGTVTMLLLAFVTTCATMACLWWTARVISPSSVRNPGWGRHPRMSTVKLELEASMGDTSLLAQPDQMPQTKYTVPPLAKAKFLKHLEDSDSYEDGRADEFETETCRAQYSWQLHSFPSCNHLHEREMEAMTVRPENKDDPLELVANGYWRDVWVLPSNNFDESQVLKTIRYMHSYEERNYDRHRRDALAMERLTSNPFVMDIYAYCGNSGIFEFAGGGDISDAVWPYDPNTGHHKKQSDLSKRQRLHIAVQAAMGLAAVHNSDKEGRPSIAHTDISPGQFVRVGDVYKLNDFNRARFLRTNVTDGSVCTYTVGNNPGKNRSPEEYAYFPQTEKIDVYSLGNIFYMLLMERWPFQGTPDKKAQKAILSGKRPSLYKDVYNSTHPEDVAIREAMFMCHEQDPKVRATAREVATYLKDQLEHLDPGRIEKWLQQTSRKI